MSTKNPIDPGLCFSKDRETEEANIRLLVKHLKLNLFESLMVIRLVSEEGLADCGGGVVVTFGEDGLVVITKKPY